MKAVQTVVFASLLALVAQVGFADDKDGVLPVNKSEKFAGVITLKVENRVLAIALTEKHKALLEEAKAVAEQINDGKMNEDADDAIAMEKKLTAVINAKDGIEYIGSTAVSSKIGQVSEKSTKACFGWGRGWGFRGGPCFNWGFVQPVFVQPVVAVVQPMFIHQTVGFGFCGGWGNVGVWGGGGCGGCW
jgi:hypothetical protein